MEILGVLILLGIIFILYLASSYEFESATILETSGPYNEYGKAYIIYRAKNGFGGYVRGGAECEKYNDNGVPYIKARLLEN